MKIQFFRPPEGFGNFGDELGPWLVDKLIDTSDFNKAPGVLMMVGTMLNMMSVHDTRPLVVFGSGAGYYFPADLTGVDVRFVRGPRTAAIYPGTKAVTDPGILVASVLKEKPQGDKISILPHWKTAHESQGLEEAMAGAGFQLIDPRWPVDKVLQAIRESRLVVTEALHGAICADAFRIPWIPILGQKGHTFKWFDWCESMGLQYNPADAEVMSIKSMIEKWPQQLSPEFHWSNRLSNVQYELDKFRTDLKHGLIK